MRVQVAHTIIDFAELLCAVKSESTCSVTLSFKRGENVEVRCLTVELTNWFFGELVRLSNIYRHLPNL